MEDRYNTILHENKHNELATLLERLHQEQFIYEGKRWEQVMNKEEKKQEDHPL